MDEHFINPYVCIRKIYLSLQGFSNFYVEVYCRFQVTILMAAVKKCPNLKNWVRNPGI